MSAIKSASLETIIGTGDLIFVISPCKSTKRKFVPAPDAPTSPKPEEPSSASESKTANRNRSDEGLVGELRRDLDSLIGLDSVKNEIHRFEAFLGIQNQRLSMKLPVTKQALHFVFSGNPEQGKRPLPGFSGNS